MKKMKNEKGQAVVEMAITLPLLLMLLCGIIDFGWIFFNQLSIANYSRESTRYAIVNSSNKTREEITYSVNNRVKEICAIGNGADLNVEVRFSNSSQASKGDITVYITKSLKTLTPMSYIFTNNGMINLNSKVTMKIE